MTNPKPNKKVFTENVAGGYRFWCAVCGKEEIVKIPETGMPMDAFIAWMRSFESVHRHCQQKPKTMGALSI